MLELNDLMKYMISEFSLNESTIKPFYPSYFKGLFNYSVRLNADRTNLLVHLNYQNILDKFKNTYFPNLHIYPQIDISSDYRMQANDFTGTISFDVNLINFDDNQSNLSITKNFRYDGMKRISSFLEKNTNTSNAIVILDNDDANMWKQIKKIFNKEISDAFNQSIEQELKLSPDNLLAYLKQQWESIFSTEEANINENYNDKIDKINKNYKLSLFGEFLNDFGYLNNSSAKKPSFDLNTGLFTTSESVQFYIDNARFIFDQDKLNPILKMSTNTNLVRIEFNATISYGLLDEEFSQDANFSLTITRSSFAGK